MDVDGADARRIGLAGEVDAANALDVEAELRRLAGEGVTAVVLEDVEFIDSAGIAMLERIGRDAGFVYVAAEGTVARRAIEILQPLNVRLVDDAKPD